ncbi:hypothetical protein D1AOALGA4SA_192 [Olavius algarvensis Delta 1 endosymbiont]|nr:hypothetical protein D1AOALGA4SA_192 [Olavius algarvensis Delta 1 endosymbiont]
MPIFGGLPDVIGSGNVLAVSMVLFAATILSNIGFGCQEI